MSAAMRLEPVVAGDEVVLAARIPVRGCAPAPRRVGFVEEGLQVVVELGVVELQLGMRFS